MCYYYNALNNNYTQTLIDVVKVAAEHGVQFRYVQLDSWWYYKGFIKGPTIFNPYKGILNWTAIYEIFPQNLTQFQASLGLPIVAHSRYFAP